MPTFANNLINLQMHLFCPKLYNNNLAQNFCYGWGLIVIKLLPYDLLNHCRNKTIWDALYFITETIALDQLSCVYIIRGGFVWQVKTNLKPTN